MENEYFEIQNFSNFEFVSTVNSYSSNKYITHRIDRMFYKNVNLFL